MKYYLFPKNFQHYSIDNLMNVTASMGFDGPTALVRDGFWISAGNAKKEMSDFINTANKYGLEVKYGSADINMDTILSNENQLDLLKIFADNGIEMVRMQHVIKRDSDNIREYTERFKAQAYNAAKAGEKVGVKCIIQIHGQCYPHNATAAYEAIKNLDPRFVGIKMDPGNNWCQEGYELYWYQAQLLGEYLSALGVKDVTYNRVGDFNADNKGWLPTWTPAYCGMINYKSVFEAVKKVGFDGPVIQMPFYCCNSDKEMEDTVAKELAYFKSCDI